MKNLQAQKFTNDPRVIAAKKSILKALSEHQQPIGGIRAAKPECKIAYDDLIGSFEKIKGGKMIMPYLSSGLGRGALVELGDGSVKYDFIIGIGVHYFGHSHPDLIEIALDAALADTVMQGNLQQNIPSVEFAKTLTDAACKNGAKLGFCFIASSGAVAGECGFKIAFQKKTPAKRLLCLKGCFMGRTMLMAQTTDNDAYRVGLPQIVEVDYVPFFDPEQPKKSSAEALEVLQQHLNEHPGEYAAMAFELVIGEGGFYPGAKEFFEPLMKLLKANDIPVLIDEVQSFGRTTELFAFQHFGLDKYVDAVWIGKASQACALLYGEFLKPQPGLLSGTYTASTAAIASGTYIVKSLLNGGYFGADGKIAKLHAHFQTKLETLAKEHPDKVSGPYGVGAMVAFTPFDGDAAKIKDLVLRLYDNGVIAFMCGKNPSRVRFLLPVGAITTDDIDVVFEVLKKTILATPSK